MKYIADIFLDEDSKNVYDCLISEINEDDRSKIQLNLKEEGLFIHIECKDSTALRASCNSITRLISVYSCAKIKN